MIIEIGHLHCRNHDQLDAILGTAGYSGSETLVDQCTRRLDLGNAVQRAEWGINDHEVEQMLGRLVMADFHVKIIQGE